VVILAQPIAHTRLAVDGRAAGHEVGDIPVNGSLRDLEALRQRRRGGHPTASPEPLDDLKKTVRAPHACPGIFSRRAGTPAGGPEGSAWTRPMTWPSGSWNIARVGPSGIFLTGMTTVAPSFLALARLCSMSGLST